MLAEFVVPFLAETANQRSFKVSIEWKAFSPTLFDSAAADVPFVIVDSLKLTKILNTNRIEMTRYRFLEVNLAIAPSFLNGTKRETILNDSVSTFAVIDKGSARQTVNINRGNTFTFNGFYTLLCHIGLDGRINPLKDGYLLFVERSSAVAFDATGTLADSEVAAEPYICQIIRYYTVVNY